MSKLTVMNRSAAVAFSMAAAAMTGPAVSVAGPGCMGGPQQHMGRAYYPSGPVMPPAAYRPGPPPVYGAAPASYAGMMAPPVYQRPLPAQRGTSSGPGETARANPRLQAASDESAPAGENVTVRINGMRFEPSSITVKPGTTVTWVHSSNMPHTITGEVDGLRSSTLNGGQQYSHTFDATGRYDYRCDFHPSMKGSVIVEAPGRDT